MDVYVVYESELISTKGQLPDVQYKYFSGSLYNPEYTATSVFALKFYELNEAKKAAEILGMEVGRLVTKVEKVY